MDGIDLLTGDTHNIVGIMIPGITKVIIQYGIEVEEIM
jgi:hypothetical protein